MLVSIYLTSVICHLTSLIPSAAATLRTTKARRCGLITLRGTTTDGLTCDYSVTFLQITFDNFRRRAISLTNCDPAGLRLSVLAKHPNEPRLTFKHRGAGWRETAFTASLLIV